MVPPATIRTPSPGHHSPCLIRSIQFHPPGNPSVYPRIAIDPYPTEVVETIVVPQAPITSSRRVVDVQPVVAQTSTIASNPTPRAEIILLNPRENSATLNYKLGPASYSLAAGFTQKVHQSCVIEFDRGGGAGSARYRLTDGTYRFKPVNGAWELVKSSAVTPEVDETLGLAANPVPAERRVEFT